MTNQQQIEDLEERIQQLEREQVSHGKSNLTLIAALRRKISELQLAGNQEGVCQ